MGISHHGVILGVSGTGTGVGLDDPTWSLPTQHIWWFISGCHQLETNHDMYIKIPLYPLTQRYLAATELGKKISILSAVLNYHFGKLSRAQILLLVMHLISIKHATLSHLVLSSRTWMASAKQQHLTTSICSSSTHYPGHHNCTSMFILFNSSSLG